jgi:sugar phosphate isomerase/epimerase
MSWQLSAFADEIGPSLALQLTTLRRLGIWGLDLRSVDDINVLALSDEQVLTVARGCHEAGVHPHCVGSPVNKVRLDDGSADAELEKLRRAVQVAKLLGVSKIRIFSPEAHADAWEAVRAWMQPQVDLAKEHDVVLLHENDGHYWGAYPENAKQLFAQFAGPNFRAVFDFSNAALLGYASMDHWFPWLLPHLDSLHIKDAKDGKVVAAGEGDGQIPETLAYLQASGWQGVLSMEPHLTAAGPYGGFSGPELFTAAVDALRRILPA